MPRREGSLAVSATLTTLQEAIQEAHTCAKCDHTNDDEYVSEYGTHDRHIVPLQVQLIMLITAPTEDLSCLYDLGCQTVAVHEVVLAVARLNELGRDPQERQVSLLLLRVGPQDFQEFGHGCLGQTFDVIITSEDRSVALA